MASLFRRVTRRLFGQVAPTWGARVGGGGAPAYVPALQFNDARNSQYIGQVT